MTNPTPYRLAAVDLDDTLLGHDKRVSAANRDAIERLQCAGVRVMLASGRRHENILRYHRELGLDGLILSCHGAMVRHAETGEILHRHYVGAELAVEIVREGQARDLAVVYYAEEGTYTSRRNRYTAIYEQRTESALLDGGDLSQFAGTSPIKLLWVGDPAALATAQPALARRYAGRLEALVTDPEYLEFMADGANKAEGLAVGAEYYAVETAATLAFGDGNNDVAMLAWAGWGVAMDHGRETAKAAANAVAPAGDPETSLARAITKLLEEPER
jgi:Cof subfamily protein (haloacid dehalogenase superfamily)